MNFDSDINVYDRTVITPLTFYSPKNSEITIWKKLKTSASVYNDDRQT